MATDTPNSDPRLVKDFDLELLWVQHGKKITTAVAIIVAVGFVIHIWQRNTAQAAEAAAARLAAARDLTTLDQIVQDYPRQEVAAQALIRLGDALFNAGKHSESAQKYQLFLEQFPAHPLAPSALIGIASVKEATGDLQGAHDQFQQVLAGNQRGYMTLAATLGMARTLEAMGQTTEARRRYEEVLAMAQGTPAQMEAYVRLATLSRNLPAEPLATNSVPTGTPARKIP